MSKALRSFSFYKTLPYLNVGDVLKSPAFIFIEGLHAIGETTLGSCGIGVQGEGFAVSHALFGNQA